MEVINFKPSSNHLVGEAVMGPTRMRRVLMVWEMGRHRFLDCVYYDDCLSKAALNGWKSFSCKECKAMKLMRDS